MSTGGAPRSSSTQTAVETEDQVRRAGAPRSAKDGAYEWARYQAWAERNSIDLMVNGQPVASAEEVLLLYLHHHVTECGWSATTVRKVGGHLSRRYVAAGQPDPRGRRWKQYLAACAERRPPGPKMDPFSENQLAALEALERSVSTSPTDRLRLAVAASLVLADLLGWTGSPASFLRKAVSLGPDVIAAWRTELAVTELGRRVILDRARRPVHFDVLSALLEVVGQDLVLGEPVASSDGQVNPIARVVDAWEAQFRDAATERTASDARRRSRAAAVKYVRAAFCWLSGRTSERAAMRADEVTQWWCESDAAERARAIRLVELGEGGVRRLADSAWFFTSLCAGSRAAEMGRLDFRHWDEAQRRGATDGYEFVLEPELHKGGRIAIASGGVREAHHVFVWHTDHAEPRESMEASEVRWPCPACTLDRYVALRQLIDDVEPEDPVFVTTEGNRVSTARAAAIVQRIWARVEHLDDHAGTRRIGSRSVRMTTATLAWTKRLSLADLAVLLGHRRGGYSTTLGYVTSQVREANEALVHPATRVPQPDAVEEVGPNVWRFTSHG